MKKKQLLFLFLIVLGILSCHKSSLPLRKKYLTKNVIIIVMDGARYSETWGDPTKANIPNIANIIAPQGVINTNFHNNAFTSTTPGHLAICSGQYYNINNGGSELPPFPTIFQYYNKEYPNNSSWIIASKDKLEVLANTVDTNFNNQFMPHTDCGINGLGTGYRNDSTTLNVALNVLSTNHPNLTLINFREPDFTAHQNDSLGYLQQIHNVDSLINIIYSFVENDPIYKEKTTIFITNDHGRHDDLNGGFSSHGDSCNGCKHILFCTYGPDFKKNIVYSRLHDQRDIATTIAELLGIDLPNTNGKIMHELFK